jgi:protein-S-isoprenylcysteine O-methyltransferase Ste14
MASSQDISQVVVSPPLVPLVTLVSSIVLQLLFPLHLFARLTGYVRLPIGAVLALAGIGMIACGNYALRINGTNVQTSLPTRVLVEKGIYGWTRNPLYVGGCLVMFAVAFLFTLDWLPLIFPVSLLVLHFGIIKREERYLERKFGAEYLRYAARVPRYLRLFAASPFRGESSRSV